MTLVSFDVLTSPKWQMLGWTFSVIEFEKGQKKLLWSSRQRVCQTFRKTTEYVLRYGWSIFVNAVFTALRSVGRPTRLPMDKGFVPIGVSQYIRDGTWEHKSVLVPLTLRRNHPPSSRSTVTMFNDAGTRLYLDLYVFVLCFKALLGSFNIF